jgi:hypothetical protein
MDIIFLPLADFLNDLANSLHTAVAEDDGWQQVTIGAGLIACFLFVLGGARQIIRWLMRTDSKDREEKRAAQQDCAQAQLLLKDTERRVDALRKFDPDVFLKEVAKARDGGVLVKRESLPQAWLDPLRPALARAYADLAQ